MQRGFTLIEMAVVISIIGLIIGGVLMSQIVIHNAELREVLVEYDRYAKGIKEFQDKYTALPGDMSTAINFWGQAAAGAPCYTTAGTGFQTCNGDGNGTIGSSAAGGAYSNAQEYFLAWEHMRNAGLIPGNYNGVQGTLVGDVNVPGSKLQPGVWRLFHYLRESTTADNWADSYGHLLQFGTAAYVGSSGQFGAAAMSGVDAYNIDVKADDGKPGTGKIRSLRTSANGAPLCTVSDTAQTTAEYSRVETIACAPYFILGY